MDNSREERKRKIEAAEQEKAQLEAKLRGANYRIKHIDRQIKQLTKSERTHRLCNRGGVLEHYLTMPGAWTDEEVSDFLKFIFNQDSVKRELENRLISIKQRSGLTPS